MPMFFSFSKKRAGRSKYGAVIDVGSGSVGVAIVALDNQAKSPVIIWTHRVVMPVMEATSITKLEERVVSTITKVFSDLSKDGLKALQESVGSAEIARVLVSVSSPWSYTVTRTIRMQAEKAFRVDKELLKELIEKASDQARTHINRNLLTEKMSLATMSDVTVNITENGYVVSDPFRDQVKKLSVSQLMSMVSARLAKHLLDHVEKLAPKADLKFNSFIYSYYQALSDLEPDIAEACLVDITAEATELGVIRRGVLEVANYVNNGTNDLTRELSAALGTTVDEALSYMKYDYDELQAKLTPEQQTKLQTATKSFTEQLTELFRRTGDALSLPHTIFLHVDHRYEKFLSKFVETAARQSTQTDHNVHLVTSKFFDTEAEIDTALLLSAYVLNQRLYQPDYVE